MSFRAPARSDSLGPRRGPLGRGALGLGFAVALAAWVLGAVGPDVRAAPEPVASGRGEAVPLLWKIERDPPAFLYGTIHVPDARVVALPGAVLAALEQSSAVYTEVAFDPATQREALRAMQLPEGQTLRALLPAPLYARVEAFLGGRGVPVAALERQKVWMIATLLPVLEHGGGGELLDQKLYSWARANGKRAAGIETVAMQVAAMQSAGLEGEIALLRETLDYLEAADATGRDPMAEMIDLYLAGDERELAAFAFAFVDRDDPVLSPLLEALIDRRNDHMAETIAEQIAEQPAEGLFFAVGAMHYPGARGVLAQLRERGLDITRVR